MALFDARSLSWPRTQAFAHSGAVALLPVGSTEAHGPHLPLSVDVVIAEEVCRRVAARLQRDVVVFPPVAYSLTDFAAPFAGTVSLTADVARPMLVGILEGIVHGGFSTVAVVNHHLEPAHFRVVHDAGKTVQAAHPSARVLVVDHRRAPTGPQLGHEFMHGGSHAGAYETSLMLAAAPHLVDQSLQRALPSLQVDLPQLIKQGATNFLECGGPDAYFGAPAEANAAEGERLFELLVDATAALIDAPPSKKT
jgi:creatinine amidohydrolase